MAMGPKLKKKQKQRHATLKKHETLGISNNLKNFCIMKMKKSM